MFYNLTNQVKERKMTLIDELYESLDQRRRPEDIGNIIAKVYGMAPLTHEEAKILNKVAKHGSSTSYMHKDFRRPIDLESSLKRAGFILNKEYFFAPGDVAEITRWLGEIENSIFKALGKSDFKHDRLSHDQRKEKGLTLSRRQYNKQFRLMARLELKTARLKKEQFKRALALASKNRLASQISKTDFSCDINTACFIAYYVARCNMRSLFTNQSQARPFDELCKVLLDRCEANPEDTNWWAIAHVLPNEEVLKHLTQDQKGQLLGSYFNFMKETAVLLNEVWLTSGIQDNMVVKRGNDSTTWNLAAGAWNKLRDGWFALMYSLGFVEAVEKVCPGKVLRLIAGDVARWHQSSGGDLHEDTLVWKNLPKPWHVFSGDVDCPMSLVEKVCEKAKVDPIASGWCAPKPGRTVERFTPTPELVHGVVVSSPLLAKIFRKAGVFSGKSLKPGDVSGIDVEEARATHIEGQESRSKAK